MIEIVVNMSNRTARISGHAGYAPRGQDIVCAGVSAIAGALVETIQENGDPSWVKIGLEGELYLEAPKAFPGIEGCFLMALNGWLQIGRQYPEYVKVRLEE